MTLNANVQTSNNKVTVYLSLGSNLGDREKTLRSAIRLLGERAGSVDAVSAFIETEPAGFKSENNFINCAVRITTQKDPFQLLELTQGIERELGRKTKSVNGIYSDRNIDILLYSCAVINTPELQIPHPRMKERDFVMKPLREILKSMYSQKSHTT